MSHVRFCLKLYCIQHNAGRYYLIASRIPPGQAKGMDGPTGREVHGWMVGCWGRAGELNANISGVWRPPGGAPGGHRGSLGGPWGAPGGSLEDSGWVLGAACCRCWFRSVVLHHLGLASMGPADQFLKGKRCRGVRACLFDLCLAALKLAIYCTASSESFGV